MSDEKLPPMQELFVKEFLIDLNATRAARAAGYSEHTAAEQASRLLKNVKVSGAIRAAMEKRAKKLELSADLVLKELLKIANSDLRKLYDADGKLLPVKSWPASIAKAVASVEVDEIWDGYGEDRQMTGYTKKVKLWDKPRALEMLGKYLKLFVERHELSGPDGAPLYRDMTPEARAQVIAELEQRLGISKEKKEENT